MCDTIFVLISFAVWSMMFDDVGCRVSRVQGDSHIKAILLLALNQVKVVGIWPVHLGRCVGCAKYRGSFHDVNFDLLLHAHFNGLIRCKKFCCIYVALGITMLVDLAMQTGNLVLVSMCRTISRPLVTVLRFIYNH